MSARPFQSLEYRQQREPPDKTILHPCNLKVLLPQTPQFWPIIGGILLDSYGVDVIILCCTSTIFTGAILTGQ